MWSAYLFQVTTGTIGPRLNYEELSWSCELNGTETISVSLRKSDLPTVDLNYWLAAWWAGVVIFWNDVPVVAGPILTRPHESISKITVNCGGIRSVLAARLVVQEYNDWWYLSQEKLTYKNLSLGTIAKRVVQRAQMKPAGALPISYPIADQAGNHERNYNGFDLQNLTCDDVLTKLSNVINGPDIMFRPRMVNDRQLTFDMWYGTDKEPRIAQKVTKIWDTRVAQGTVSDMSLIYTGSYQSNRVYSLGAGQDKGLLIKVSHNDGPLQKQFPLLERVINIGNSENPSVVQGYGDASIKTNEDALLEVQMTVRGDGDNGFGKFWPGDMAQVYVKGWLSLPDGMTEMRILSLTGNSSNNVRISLQREDKFD